jgi:hypothetical protein
MVRRVPRPLVFRPQRLGVQLQLRVLVHAMTNRMAQVTSGRYEGNKTKLPERVFIQVKRAHSHWEKAKGKNGSGTRRHF